MKAITKLSQLDLKKQYSYADYLTWKFTERVELIRGWILQMSPAPSLTHQKVLWNISGLLHVYFDDKKSCNVFFAPIDVRLLNKLKSASDKDVYTVVQPDICIICDEAKLDERGCIGSPDLVVEIISPGNSKREMKTKYELYEQNLVREYWIINYEESYVMQYELKNKKFHLCGNHFDDDTFDCKIFKDMKIKVIDLFKKK